MWHKRVHAGFSLIELMVVVAIVGLLAVTAIPRYQDYTTRAKLTEALQLVAAARVSVAEAMVTRGGWPESLEEAGVEEISSEVVKKIELTKKGNDAVLTVTVHNTGNPQVDGKSFSMRGEMAQSGGTGTVQAADGSERTLNARGVISWRCLPGNASGAEPIPNSFLPANCRSGGK
ncbi:fimbrial major subunit PilE [Paludibacterium sp. THUN1379]|uniref:pilin n=1 Tax=Paludibacterium sp. THUN1379 TaxID=3112107 RepID=UPI003090A10A|nr:fimbrial major subunit PilE [Paludibacterium sp. THUN1379]